MFPTFILVIFCILFPISHAHHYLLPPSSPHLLYLYLHLLLGIHHHHHHHHHHHYHHHHHHHHCHHLLRLHYHCPLLFAYSLTVRMYHNISIDDVASENIQQHFDLANDFIGTLPSISFTFPFHSDHTIDKHIKENTGVLIHCVAGVSRSASVLIAYLMKV